MMSTKERVLLRTGKMSASGEPVSKGSELLVNRLGLALRPTIVERDTKESDALL
jgi:hypothetical protein